MKTPVWQVRGWLRPVGRLLQTRGQAALQAVSPNLSKFDLAVAKQNISPWHLLVGTASQKNRTGKFSDNSFESSMHLRNFFTVIKRTKSVRDLSWHFSPHRTHVAVIPCENKLQKLTQILWWIQQISCVTHLETFISVINRFYNYLGNPCVCLLTGLLELSRYFTLFMSHSRSRT